MEKTIYIFIISLFSLPLFSQEFEALYESVQTKYGLDQTLVNGAYFERTNRGDIGHPYFLSSDFQKGYLIIHDKRFDNLLLKYNVFDQNILVGQETSDDIPIFFLPPIEHITEFVIASHKFRKYQFPGNKTQFYEEIYSEHLSCLYEWQKIRKRSDFDRNYFVFKYYAEKKKSYIVQEQTLKQYKSKTSFLKIFPAEHKKYISRYMKENRINVKTSPNYKISELMAFCEKLLRNE